MSRHDDRVERYIAEAAPFAQPILRHFRKLAHAACPELDETMKWSMPFFVKDGRNVCHMAAFKAHCAIGFWHPAAQELIRRDHGAKGDAMGVFGRILSIPDLPAERELKQYIRAAAALVDQPRRPTAAAVRPARRAPRIPPDLSARLKDDGVAAAAFAKFSPSHRREYIEWITEAKRPETRATRIETTLAWLRDGKTRHWKYERK